MRTRNDFELAAAFCTAKESFDRATRSRALRTASTGRGDAPSVQHRQRRAAAIEPDLERFEAALHDTARARLRSRAARRVARPRIAPSRRASIPPRCCTRCRAHARGAARLQHDRRLHAAALFNAGAMRSRCARTSPHNAIDKSSLRVPRRAPTAGEPILAVSGPRATNSPEKRLARIRSSAPSPRRAAWPSSWRESSTSRSRVRPADGQLYSAPNALRVGGAPRSPKSRAGARRRLWMSALATWPRRRTRDAPESRRISRRVRRATASRSPH